MGQTSLIRWSQGFCEERIPNKQRFGEVELNKDQGNIVIYRGPDGSISLHVRLQENTIWLSLNEMASLFERDKSVISRHLRNIYKTGELDHDSTVAFFATVQTEGGRSIQRRIEYFNLDAIISVGYRVNSKRGTQFRIWATNVLRNHLIQGYTVNERRLKELSQAIRLIADIAEHKKLTGDEAAAVIRVVADYSHGWEQAHCSSPVSLVSAEE